MLELTVVNIERVCILNKPYQTVLCCKQPTTIIKVTSTKAFCKSTIDGVP